MKNPEKTATLIMICIVALVAAYGLGLCINEIKASRAKANQNKLLIKEIKKLESAPSGEMNQETAFANMQNRNSRDGSTMNRQGGFNRGGMFGDSAAMGMGTRNIDQQSRASTALSDNQDTRKAVEDPNNSNVQGGR